MFESEILSGQLEEIRSSALHTIRETLTQKTEDEYHDIEGSVYVPENPAIIKAVKNDMEQEPFFYVEGHCKLAGQEFMDEWLHIGHFDVKTIVQVLHKIETELFRGINS